LCGIIIDDTIKGIRGTFLEQGVDPLIIQELKEVRGKERKFVFLRREFF
jgi:hypothetical protein